MKYDKSGEYTPKAMAELCERNARKAEQAATDFPEAARLFNELSGEFDYAADRFAALEES